MIYYLCFYALSSHGYADQNKLLVLNLYKITELRKQKLKAEILHDFKRILKTFKF